MPHGLLGHYAGFVSRLIALFIDGFVVTVIVSVTVWGIAVTQALLQLSAVAEQLNLQRFIIEPNPILVGVFGTIFFAVYLLFFWTTTGRTPGKAFMGLRVVTIDGKRLSLIRGVMRLLGYVIAALPLYIGFLWSLVDDRRQGLHDKLAGTCVIYTWAARPDERFLAHQLHLLAPPPKDDR